MRIGLVAGEPSGDLLGAGLIRAISEREPAARFEGVAGPAMAAAGCEVWEQAEALEVFGLLEPLVHIPRLLRLRRSLIRRWRATPPDVFVGIDAPDFNFGLERALRKSGIRTAHYVSPTIWAWRPGRIKTVAKAADRVLCILPFEPAIYAERNIDAVFVGHPKATSMPTDVNPQAVRELLGLGDGRVVAVLPGSRRSEVLRLGPDFAAAAALVAGSHADVQFVTPVANPELRPLFEQQLIDAGVRDRFRLIDGDSAEAMCAADVVLLASGTAALESAMLCRPTVAAYAIGRLSGALIRGFVGLQTKYFTMPNVLVDSPLIPEFIQENMQPEPMARAVSALLDDPARREEIARRFAKLRSELALGADERAAEAVIDLAR